jgi:hypothetical protein
MEKYDDNFYNSRYEDGALKSAKELLPIIMNIVNL